MSLQKKHITLVGAGAIGSVLGPLVARMGDVVDSVTVIDPDVFENKNLASQEILPRDVGRAKAKVLAQKIQAINPNITARAIVARVEQVPIGELRSKAILAALDNRPARRCVNQAARWLGTTWIDTGVEPSAMLARVNVYAAQADQPCLECAWSEADYARLGAIYPCRRQQNPDFPSNSPVGLGSVAASLGAIELRKVLSGTIDDVIFGMQVTLCVRPHAHHVTRFRVNPACRCQHAAWTIASLRLRRNCTVAQLLETTGGSSLCVDGKSFVRTLACPACGARRSLLRLDGRMSPAVRACRVCHVEMVSIGFDERVVLSAATIQSREFVRTLHSIGLVGGDIVAIEKNGNTERFELKFSDEQS